MCPYCHSLLKGFCIPHAEEHCPLRQAFYCSRCAMYGHRLGTCRSRHEVVLKEKGEKAQRKEILSGREWKRKGQRVTFLPPLE